MFVTYFHHSAFRALEMLSVLLEGYDSKFYELLAALLGHDSIFMLVFWGVFVWKVEGKSELIGERVKARSFPLYPLKKTVRHFAKDFIQHINRRYCMRLTF